MPKIKPFYKIEPTEWLCTGNGFVAAEQKKALNDPSADEYRIEEYVRQWILRELIETYNYPESWFSNDGTSGRVYLEWEVSHGVNLVRADIALLNEWRRPFLFIECKNRSINIYSRPSNNKASAVEQVQGYTSAILEANVCIATNGEDFYAGRIQVDPSQFVNFPDIPSYERSKTTLDKYTLSKSVELGEESETLGGEGLQEATNFEVLLNNIHDILRGDENLQPDEALDEMCKLMFIKFYDEINTKLGEDYKFQEYLYGNSVELGSAIRTIYNQAKTEEKERLKRRGKYDASKSVFDEKILLKDNTIKRIVEILQPYSLKRTSVDVRGRAFQNFLGTTFRGNLGQYFTPEPIVKLMVGILNPTDKDLCIDPACGSARILTQILDYVRENSINNKFGDEKLEWDNVKNYAEDRVHGIEVSRRLVRVAVMDMMIYDDGRSNIRCTDGLEEWDNYHDLEPEQFSIVATNPPFGASITDPLVLTRFALGQGQSSVPKDILFLERCFQLLKPGGRMGIVLPDGILSHTKNRDVAIKEYYRDHGKVVAIIALPFHTFVPFGANAKTSLVFFRKWGSKEEKAIDYDIHMLEIEDIGYNPSGEVYSNGEIDEVVSFVNKLDIWSEE
ncbi:restriction endonuclease subunit M [Alkalicoccobacillus gibsonii]|uniref:restriction endonuclease subunit M n=1 Tax=Alkalicoccobacillus gibsonii TaxID=79881 RepID=UPI003515004E